MSKPTHAMPCIRRLRFENMRRGRGIPGAVARLMKSSSGRMSCCAPGPWLGAEKATGATTVALVLDDDPTRCGGATPRRVERSSPTLLGGATASTAVDGGPAATSSDGG